MNEENQKNNTENNQENEHDNAEENNSDNSSDAKTGTREEFKVNGEDLLKRVKELIAAGNARRISIKNDEGKTLMEIPLTWGAIGAVLLPTLAAVGAIAALLTKCTIVVERK